MALHYIPITGGVLSGKSSAIKQIIDTLQVNNKVQICGFIQPSNMIGDEREGYQLLVFENDGTHEFDFARPIYDAQPGQLPYTFNQTGFDETLNIANNFVFSSQKILCIIDEFARLETLKKGHYPALLKWVERLRSQNAIFVITFALRRNDVVPHMLQELGFEELVTPYQAPLNDTQIKEIIESIES